MSDTKHSDTLAHWVHWSLLIGVVVSGLVLADGLFRVPQLGSQDGSPHTPVISQILRGASHQEGVPLINLGLLILMVTPVLRISVLGLGWFMGGDFRFGTVALVVLLLLGLSMSLGIG